MLAAIVIGWVVLVVIYASSFATAGNRPQPSSEPLIFASDCAGRVHRAAGSLWEAVSLDGSGASVRVSARSSRRDADRDDHEAPVDRMRCVGAIYLPPVLAVRPRGGRRRAAAGHDAEADRVD
jgi:hypothetical protein